VMKR